MKKLWPLNKLYQLNRNIHSLLKDNEQLKKDLVQLQTVNNNIIYDYDNMREELSTVARELQSLKINNADLTSKMVEVMSESENQLMKLNSYMQRNNDESWMTKFGYDTMISDLQMTAIEHIVPGNRDRLLALKNTHKGEKCFVIGNGPSLTASDLTKLKENNMFCFASKRINLIFDKTEWRPNIWGASDLDYIKLYKEEISNLTGFPKLLCAQSIVKHDVEIKDAIYYPFIQVEREPQWFNADIMRGVHFWGTVTCKLINFAVYMGFTEIYLLGCDNTYPLKKDADGKISIDNRNSHFSGKYHTEEEAKEVNKNIDNIIKSLDYITSSFRNLKWFCDSMNIQVYNATRGGELEVFPRIEFDKVLLDCI